MGGKTVGKGTVSVVIYHAVVTAEGCKAESPEIRFKVLGKVKGVYAVIFHRSIILQKTQVEPDYIMPQQRRITRKFQKFGHGFAYIGSALYHVIGYSRKSGYLAADAGLGVNKSGKGLRRLAVCDLYGGNFDYFVIKRA